MWFNFLFCVPHSKDIHQFFLWFLFQVAEKILNKKDLEFYRWNGDLSQLLQNVREKLNRVAEVVLLELFFPYNSPWHIPNFDPFRYTFNISALFILLVSNTIYVGFKQNWSREEKNHCLDETEKSFKFSGDILRLILSWCVIAVVVPLCG